MTHVGIPLDAGGFRLLDRRVVDALQLLPERNRFVRGIRSWVGFRQVGLDYERDARYAGTWWSSPCRSSCAFAARWHRVGFSCTRPLRLAMYARLRGLGPLAPRGLLLAGVDKPGLRRPDVVPGWTSLIMVIWILGGIQRLALGVIGEYIARIHDEVKPRPVYILRGQIRARTRCGRLLRRPGGTYVDEVSASVRFSDITTSTSWPVSQADILVDLVRRSLGPRALHGLDVGCGTGVTDRHLVDRFGGLTGVDVAAGAVAVARAANPEASYLDYDGHHLPFADDTFDVASRDLRAPRRGPLRPASNSCGRWPGPCAPRWSWWRSSSTTRSTRSRGWR